MEDTHSTTTFLFEFDIKVGPVFTACSCPEKNFDTNLIEKMKINCFPESCNKLPQGVHTFCFSVQRLFCYTAFISVKNPKSARYFDQYSIVIATELSYYPLFMKLLESIKSLKNLNSPKSTFNLVNNFVSKWSSHLPFKIHSKFELPLFDGSVPINPEPKLNHLLSTQSKFYCANLNFIGSDLINDIETDFEGALKLWEISICDQPALIEACTPQKATNAAFAIASLSYPEDSPTIIPYISVIDERFAALSERPKGIIGTSNPAAENLMVGVLKEKMKLIKIGFSNNKNKSNMNSAQMRYKLYLNTKRLRVALTEALDELISKDIMNVLLGNINISILAEKLISNNVQTASSINEFANQIIKSRLYKKICRERLSKDESVNRFLSLDIDDLIKPQLARKICVGLIHVMQDQNVNKNLEKMLKKKLRSLATIFHSDQSSSSNSD